MRADEELMHLCELNGQELTDLLLEDYGLSNAKDSTAETRMLSYLHDLREVLRLQSGAGVRVLRMWLDEACLNSRSGGTLNLRERAALQDYARDRMADVALADPVCHVRLQLQFSKEWAAASGNNSEENS